MQTSAENESKGIREITGKDEYRAPQLLVYGAMGELTAGGSSNNPEANQVSGMNPARDRL